MNARRQATWSRRSRRRWLTRLIPAVAVALGVAGVAFAVVLLAQGGENGTEIAPPPPGKIAVVLNPRPLDAYHRVRVEDLIHPQTKRLSTVYLDPERLPDGVLIGPAEISGRVLARPKAAGFVFTETDFAPKGTRAGIAAGIPPGKRAMRVDVSKVAGLESLNVGDRFDLVATLPLQREAFGGDGIIGGYSTADLTTLDPRLANWTRQATVDVIVQNGLLVQPMSTRSVPVYVSSLTQGGITRTKPVQEVVVALAPEEVARLTQAIAVEAQVQAVIRSGHPDDPEDSVTPSFVPRSPLGTVAGSGGSGGAGYAVMETITGNERRYVAVGSPYDTGTEGSAADATDTVGDEAEPDPR